MFLTWDGVILASLKGDFSTTDPLHRLSELNGVVGVTCSSLSVVLVLT